MIRGYTCNGFLVKAIILYRQMSSFGHKAKKFMYPFMIKACGDLLSVEIGTEFMVRRWFVDLIWIYICGQFSSFDVF